MIPVLPPTEPKWPSLVKVLSHLAKPMPPTEASFFLTYVLLIGSRCARLQPIHYCSSSLLKTLWQASLGFQSCSRPHSNHPSIAVYSTCKDHLLTHTDSPSLHESIGAERQDYGDIIKTTAQGWDVYLFPHKHTNPLPYGICQQMKWWKHSSLGDNPIPSFKRFSNHFCTFTLRKLPHIESSHTKLSNSSIFHWFYQWKLYHYIFYIYYITLHYHTNRKSDIFPKK